MEEPALPLPDDYLIYEHRNYGMDNPHYEWQPLPSRGRLEVGGGIRSVATIIVPLEFFPLDPPKAPFLHPGAMKTPYPDLRHYTVRDYGNRVGVFRLLRALDEAGLYATFAVNAAVAEAFPSLVETVKAAGHEVAAHGISTAHIHHDGLSSADEAEWIDRVRATFPDAVSWMSPARNQGFRTLDLIAKAGFQICLDWEADQRPCVFNTLNGPIKALPNYNELSDFKLLLDRSQTEAEWCEQIVEAARYSIDLHDNEGASAFAFTLTPYIAGQPFRMSAVRRILAELNAVEGLAIKSAADAVALFDGAKEER